MINDSAASVVLDAVAGSRLRGSALRALAMAELRGLSGYDWCGVYRLEGNTLVLDEYVGAATDHTRIQVGFGVCGTAVSEDANQVVADVRERENYLACSIETRAEIVVLIRRGRDVLGQIDIDGHTVGAFDQSDERFLDRLASILAHSWDDV